MSTTLFKALLVIFAAQGSGCDAQADANNIRDLLNNATQIAPSAPASEKTKVAQKNVAHIMGNTTNMDNCHEVWAKDWNLAVTQTCTKGETKADGEVAKPAANTTRKPAKKAAKKAAAAAKKDKDEQAAEKAAEKEAKKEAEKAAKNAAKKAAKQAVAEIKPTSSQHAIEKEQIENAERRAEKSRTGHLRTSSQKKDGNSNRFEILTSDDNDTLADDDSGDGQARAASVAAGAAFVAVGAITGTVISDTQTEEEEEEGEARERAETATQEEEEARKLKEEERARRLEELAATKAQHASENDEKRATLARTHDVLDTPQKPTRRMYLVIFGLACVLFAFGLVGVIVDAVKEP
jgi:hypothetical protein